jgi:tetratricopeptide (TPR) repeat protein/transcriptional regulator with XRE-family HTH domain
MGESFGQALRRFRLRAGLNISELAEAVGANRKSIMLWEHDRRVPRDRARMLDLAQILRLSVAETDLLMAAQRPARLPPIVAVSGPSDDQAPSPASLLHTQCHQLRLPVADFIGRGAESAQLIDTLRTTLTQGHGAVISGMHGMGGIGKTELAYVVAHQMLDTFPDAQIVLTLEGSSAAPLSPEQVLQTVIRAFMPDAQLADDLTALETRYRTLLHGRRAFILADDAYNAAQVRVLIPPQGSALLITSRQRFTLPGMASIHLEQLGPDESVEILRRICPRLNQADARRLAEMCGHLPLALRVSGSILHNNPALPIATYLSQLADERRRLRSLRDPDDAQLDVAASLALSYARLGTTAQRVFRQLGTIAADFSTALAQAVVDAQVDGDVETILHQLLRRNLIMYDAARMRWRLHDLVRDLARGYLDRAMEAGAAARRYAQAAVQIAQAIETQYLAGGDDLLAALAWFDTERPHVNAAWHWALRHAGEPEADRLLLAAMAAVCNIGPLRYDRRHEEIPQLEQALAAARRLSDQQSERLACHGLGGAYWSLGEPRRSILYFEQALTIAQALGDRRREGRVLTSLGNVCKMLGEPERSIPYYEQALAIAHALDDRRGEGLALHNLGLAYHQIGQGARAIACSEQALRIAQELGEWYGESTIRCGLGLMYVAQGNPRRGARAARHALTLAREIRDRRFEGYAQYVLGRAYAALHNPETASGAFTETLAIFREIGDRNGEAMCNWEFGLALAGWGQHERALPLLRAAVAYEQEIGHAQWFEHAALLAELEAREPQTGGPPHSDEQHAVGGNDTIPKYPDTRRR